MLIESKNDTQKKRGNYNQPRLASSNQKTRCPECGGQHLIRDSNEAEVVCASCGLVISDTMLDRGPEWRAFDVEQRARRSRVGSRTTFAIHDKGLSTNIGWLNRDALGRAVPVKRRAQLYRMRKLQRRARVSNAKDRNLTSALITITKLSAELRLPNNVLETASMVYRQMLQRNLIRGRTIHTVGTASVYMACRKCGIARTLDEVAAASGIARKDLGRAYRFIRKQLSGTVPLMAPEHYVSRFMNHLDLEGSTETLTLKLIRAARQAQLTDGKAPISIAAAAIYIAALVVGKRRTQRQIAEVTNITEVTVRNRYKDLVETLDIVVTL